MTNSSNRKIEKVTAVDQVVQNIKEMIADGTFPAKCKIPSEMALAEMFGVNRLTIRSALQRLSTIGVVESRVGDGTYIKEFSPLFWIEMTKGFPLSERRQLEMRQLRRVMELECCRLAIVNATAKEKEMFSAGLNAFIEIQHRMFYEDVNSVEWQNDYEQAAELDCVFHEQLWQMSHNQLFWDIYMSLREFIRINIEAELKSVHKNGKNRNLPVDHRDICQGILTNNITLCQQAYERMLPFEA